MAILGAKIRLPLFATLIALTPAISMAVPGDEESLVACYKALHAAKADFGVKFSHLDSGGQSALVIPATRKFGDPAPEGGNRAGFYVLDGTRLTFVKTPENLDAKSKTKTAVDEKFDRLQAFTSKGGKTYYHMALPMRRPGDNETLLLSFEQENTKKGKLGDHGTVNTGGIDQIGVTPLSKLVQSYQGKPIPDDAAVRTPVGPVAYANFATYDKEPSPSDPTPAIAALDPASSDNQFDDTMRAYFTRGFKSLQKKFDAIASKPKVSQQEYDAAKETMQNLMICQPFIESKGKGEEISADLIATKNYAQARLSAAKAIDKFEMNQKAKYQGTPSGGPASGAGAGKAVDSKN